MSEISFEERTARQFSLLAQGLDSGRLGPVRRMVNSLNPAEIGRLLESLPPAKRAVAWNLVDAELDGEVLVHVHEDVREQLIAEMDETELLAAAQDLDLDDLADLIEDLPEGVVTTLLAAMEHEHRERLEQVLAYAEDVAGGLMNADFITVRGDVTVGVVRRFLRRRYEIPPGTDHVYVVNRDGEYQGRLSFATLLIEDEDTLVSTITDVSLPPILAQTSVRQVIADFQNYDLISAPVVDRDNVLIGRITVDDVLDRARDDADDNVLSLGQLSEDEDLFGTVLGSARRRGLWLAVNLATAFIAATVVGAFEGTIQQLVALAVLMPVVASMGGVAGTQTLTLIVRGLAIGTVNAGNVAALLRKQLGVAFVNGLVFGSLIGAVTLLWFGDPGLAKVIGLAVLANLLIAGFFGTMIPIVLKRLDVDPALAGSVALTALTDTLGFFLLLGLGAWLLLGF